MLPEDIQDLMIAFALLIVFIIIGIGFQSFTPGDEDEFIYETLNLRDEEEVFFLNFLKTEIEDKTIADLIILSEDEDQNLKEKIDKILRFYGKDYYEYGLRIKYPNEEIEDIDFGCTYEIEKIGLKQNLPSLNEGLIELYFAFRGVECIPF